MGAKGWVAECFLLEGANPIIHIPVVWIVFTKENGQLTQ